MEPAAILGRFFFPKIVIAQYTSLDGRATSATSCIRSRSGIAPIAASASATLLTGVPSVGSDSLPGDVFLPIFVIAIVLVAAVFLRMDYQNIEVFK